MNVQESLSKSQEDSSQDFKKTFCELSALLTGFHPEALEDTGRLSEFFNYAMERIGGSLEPLLKSCAAFLEAHGEETKCFSVGCMSRQEREMALSQLIGEASPGVDLAGVLTKMWYLGSWYETSDSSGQVISESAYLRGLVWQVMQSHPMGKSRQRYGYWEKEPLSLNTGHAQTEETSDEP